MRRLTALAVSFLLLLASCGSDDSPASTSDEASGTTVEPSQNAGDSGGEALERSSQGDLVDAGAPEALGSGGGNAPPVVNNQETPLQPIDIGRDIIFTATIEIEVENLGSASQLALTRIEAMGGLLFGQTTSTQGTPFTVLTFKVAPQDFQAALRALGEVGEIRDQNISTTDVTERVVDLESQIITSEASVERLRGFLSNATELNQIAQLERELLDRETVLERLRGQLRTVQAQVALATITVTMTEHVPGPALSLAETSYLGHDGGATCGGDPQVNIDEGDPFTICLEITNVGDTHLTAIEIREEALKLKTNDFTPLEGSLDGLLAPDTSVSLFYEGTAESSFGGQAQATARAVDSDGASIGQGTVAARSSVSVSVAPDNSLPGFMSGFETGFATLAAIIAALVLGFGFALPLLPLVVLAWFAIRTARRRLDARPKPAATFPPPPPQPQRESVSAQN